MTSRSGFWVGAALLLVTAGAALGTFELIQRNRYAELERRMFGALEAFQARARLSLDKNSDPIVVGVDVPATVTFKNDTLPDLTLSPWSLRLVALQPGVLGDSYQGIQVRKLVYRRHLLLLVSPEFEIEFVKMVGTNSLIALFDGVLKEHGVAYRFLWPEK